MYYLLWIAILMFLPTWLAAILLLFTGHYLAAIIVLLVGIFTKELK